MIPNADNTKYIESQNIRVFPCAYRGYYEENGESVVFDPEARSTTESNFTDTFHKLSVNKDSYVVAWVPKIGSTNYGTLKCVIGGYYFEIYNHTIADFFSATKPYYLCIKTEQINLGTSEADNDSRTTEVLSSFADTTNYLDINTAAGYAFTGLLLSTEAVGDFNLLPFVAETSFIKSIKATTSNKEAQINHYYLNESDALVKITTVEEAAPNGTQLYIKSDSYGVNSAAMPITDILDVGSGKYSIRMLEDITEQGTNTTTASGDYAVALGKGTKALGEASTTLGSHTTANADNQVVIGEYNYLDNTQAFIIAKGDSNRESTANKFTVSYKGDVKATGELDVAGKATIGRDLTVEGNLTITGKAQSSTTTSTDSDSTLTTKNYVDSLISGVNTNHTSLSNDLSTLDSTLQNAKEELNNAIEQAKEELSNAIEQAKDDLDEAQTTLGTLQTNITTLSTNVTSVGDKLTAAKSTPASGAGTGKYIISVSQEEGKISATEGSLISSLDPTNETDIPNPKAIADYVGTKVNAINNTINSTLAGIWNTATVKESTSDTAGKALKSIILDAIYPVGSIYIHHVASSQAVPTECPIAAIGGTWIPIEEGRFLMAVGDGRTFTRGDTGGSADACIVEHTHDYILNNTETTETELSGGHHHAMDIRPPSGVGNYTGPAGSRDNTNNEQYFAEATKDSGWHTHKLPNIKSEGENGSGKNLPPYLAVYMWRRVEDEKK